MHHDLSARVVAPRPPVGWGDDAHVGLGTHNGRLRDEGLRRGGGRHNRGRGGREPRVGQGREAWIGERCRSAGLRSSAASASA